jgi:hypothetical protein
MNPPREGALVYVDSFSRDAIHEFEKASLGFPYEVFLSVCVLLLLLLLFRTK